MAQLQSKTEKVIAFMEQGEWNQAIALAATFRIDPIEDRRAVVSAHEADVSPRFHLSLGKNPDLIFDEGCLVLIKRYGLRCRRYDLKLATRSNSQPLPISTHA